MPPVSLLTPSHVFSVFQSLMLSGRFRSKSILNGDLAGIRGLDADRALPIEPIPNHSGPTANHCAVHFLMGRHPADRSDAVIARACFLTGERLP